MRRFFGYMALCFALLATVPVFGGKDGVPFPLSAKLPIPWSTIEGVYEIRDGSSVAMFNFQVYKTGEGSQMLRVTHINPQFGRVVSVGIGVPSISDQMFRSIMKGDDFDYYMTVEAYRDGEGDKAKTAVVAGIRSLDASGPVSYFVMQKISNKSMFDSTQEIGQQVWQMGKCSDYCGPYTY